MNGLFDTRWFAGARVSSHGPCQVGRWFPALFVGLLLSTSSMVVMASAAAGSAGSPPLPGTAWNLLPLDGPAPTPAAPTDETAAQLRLEAEPPRVSGSTGCNRVIGTYVLDGAQLRITTTATTRRACMAEGADTRERDFLARLDQVRGWRIADGLLLLSDASGTPVLRLRAAR